MIDKNFEKNDKSLKIVKTIVQVTDIILAALSIILGIICFCAGGADGIATGLVFIIAVPLAIGLLYLIKDLMFSLMTDIKFIRNMLYDSVSMNVNSNRLKQEANEDANIVKKDTTEKDIVKQETEKDKKRLKKIKLYMIF